MGLWNDIRKGWGKFSKHTSFEVGDGVRIKFWLDWWYSNRALRDACPKVNMVAQVKDASVADLLETNREICCGL